ncbi:MacS family sensor histidine kinase [Streptomonospora nanhaiensis]
MPTASAVPTASAGPAAAGAAARPGFTAPLWRAIAVFRVASLVYAVVLVVQHRDLLAHPLGAFGVLAVMAAWTAGSAYLYARPNPPRRTWALLAADLALAFGCLAGTALVVEPGYLRMGPPLTTTWFAGAALAAAVIGGRRWALGVALAHGVADICVRLSLGLTITAAVPRGVALLMLAGYAVGYMANYAHLAERRFTEAVELAARTRERERLARSIHDSVLQVLALVQRRGAEAGGEAAELGRLAGEQEAKLRALIDLRDGAGTGIGGPGSDGAAGGIGTPATEDLAARLRARASARVSVSAPATEVRLPQHTAAEIDSAVGEALANVDRHCPDDTRVWLLVEDEGDTVAVTVRDDGPGMAEDRLAQACAEGRMGVAHSIRSRITDLGGTTMVTTAPGQGTEIELRVPR